MQTLSTIKQNKTKASKPSNFFSSTAIYPKLTINQPNDKYEKQADAMANRVMAMPENEVMQKECEGCEPEGNRIQRQEEEKEEEEPSKSETLDENIAPIQTKSNGGGMQASPVLQSQLQATKGGGFSLPKQTNRFMSTAFGTDFSHVRIHANQNADKMNKSIQAKAFTNGSDIYMRNGQYNPGSSDGKRLLGHELGHVVQQMHTNDNNTINRIQMQNWEDVWGFKVQSEMCGCIDTINEDIDFANLANKTYAKCDKPKFKTGDDVENCFDQLVPDTEIVGETSIDDEIVCAQATDDPCSKIERRACLVHETFHARQTERIVKQIGGEFYKEWEKLKGVPDRLEKLRAKFPAEVSRMETEWYNAHNWAQGEVESYTWERRFLKDVKKALKRICATNSNQINNRLLV